MRFLGDNRVKDDGKGVRDVDLQKIMTDYGDYCLRVAYLYTQDWLAAEEVVQDVFLAYAMKPENFRGDSALKTYLVKITVYKSHDYLRKQKKWWHMKEKTTAASAATAVERKSEETMLLNALNELSLKYREVLILYYYEELNTTEISELLNCSVHTVKTRLNRARQALKPLLREEDLEVLLHGEL